jgi:hypothetical protein
MSRRIGEVRRIYAGQGIIGYEFDHRPGCDLLQRTAETQGWDGAAVASRVDAKAFKNRSVHGLSLALTKIAAHSETF